MSFGKKLLYTVRDRIKEPDKNELKRRDSEAAWERKEQRLQGERIEEEHTAVHKGRLKYLEKSAAKGGDSGGRWGKQTGSRMMDVFGGGGGRGSRRDDIGSRLDAVLGSGSGGGGRGRRDDIGSRMDAVLSDRPSRGSRSRDSGGMMGLGSFEKKMNAALEGRPYREKPAHKRKKMPRMVVIGGKRYYR